MLGALAAWSVYWLFGCDPLAVYLLHILAWFMLDWLLLSILQVLESIKVFLLIHNRQNSFDFYSAGWNVAVQ